MVEMSDIEKKLQLYERTLARERRAKERAEQLLEQSSLDFFKANEALKKFLDSITNIFVKSASEFEIYQTFVSAVCGITRWPIGHVYFLDKRTQPEQLSSAKIWHCPKGEEYRNFQQASQAIQFKPGVGLPGRTLSTGEVTWINDIYSEENFPRLKLLKEAVELHAAFAVPIKSNGKTVAVAEFFSTQSIREIDWILALVESFSIQIGTCIDRLRFERELLGNMKKLDELNQKLQSVQENMVNTAKMSALGEMAGGIAHESNNPLAILKATAEQIHKLVSFPKVDVGQVKKSALRLEKTVDRIASIVKGLQFFSREGYQDPVEMFSVKGMIDQTLGLCQEIFSSKGLQLVIEPYDENLRIEGREIQISQVLLNLLNNAKDALENESNKLIKISVSEFPGDIEIRVLDSGKGVPAGFVSKIFQPFYTTKPVGQGTGLGLSVSIGIVEQLNGSLKYEAGHGGACFVIRLPKMQKLLVKISA